MRPPAPQPILEFSLNIIVFVQNEGARSYDSGGWDTLRNNRGGDASTEEKPGSGSKLRVLRIPPLARPTSTGSGSRANAPPLTARPLALVVEWLGE